MGVAVRRWSVGGSLVAFAAAGAAFVPGAAKATTPSPSPISALPCSAGYGGGATICSGEVPSFDAVPDGAMLDVDITKPLTGAGQRHPLIVLLHGFGNNKHEWESTTDEGDGADKWHWNSHWFAEHGYYVLTYTARGFTDQGPDRADEPKTPGGRAPNCVGPENPQSPSASSAGSDCTPGGTIRVKNKNVEIRDTQWLAAVTVQAFPDIDPNKIAVSGGSYGGGESWLQAADPVWSFPNSQDPSLPVLHVQVAVPKYPWTDLTYALAPNGHPGGVTRTDVYSSDQGDPRSSAAATRGDGNPAGVEKQSYVSGLYALGTKTGTFDTGLSTTPQSMPPDPETPAPTMTPNEPFSAWLARLDAGEPYSTGPHTDEPVVDQIRHAFSGWHSAYYQPGWASQAASNQETAIFSISGWTDDLFPPVESFRMFNYLKSLDPLWPVAVGVGDVGHSRAQNKPATWHRLNDQAWQFLQSQISGSHRQQTTVFSEPTVCTTTTTPPAEQLTGRTPQSLANGTLVVDASTKPATLDGTSGSADPNGLTTDAVFGSDVPSTTPSESCRVAGDTGYDGAGGPGGYRAYSAPLQQHKTTIGIQYVSADYTASTPGDTAIITARLWDVAPDGTALLVTRGVYRLDFLYGDQTTGTVRVPFYGNQWNLKTGHKIRIDLQQVDAPTYRPPTGAVATLNLTNIKAVLPTRDASNTTIPAS